MRIQILVTTICLAFCAASTVLGQTSKPSVPQASRPTTKATPKTQTKDSAKSTTKIVVPFAPDPTMAEATALFERAKKNQIGTLPRGKVTSFQGDFIFCAQIPEEENQPVRQVEGDYLQKWAFIEEDGQRKFAYRRTVKADLSDWNVTLVSDFDDHIFGFDKKRPIRVSSEKNKQRIADEKRSAQRLYSLLFLNELQPIANSFRVIARNQPCSIEIGQTSARVRMGSKSATVIGFTNQNKQRIKLWIDTDGKATPEVMKAEVIDPKTLFHEKIGGKRVIAPEVFELGYYWPLKLPTGEVVRFPTRVRYKIGGKELMNITVQDFASLKLNSISGKRNLTRTFRFDD